MNTYYEVVSMFYDSGKVTAIINEIRADEKPKNEFYSLGTHDTYRDYFDDLQSAKDWQYGALYA